MSAPPTVSYINLFLYRQDVINLNAEVPNRAFNFGVPSRSCTALRLPVRL
jgi:hypothetical protein